MSLFKDYLELKDQLEKAEAEIVELKHKLIENYVVHLTWAQQFAMHPQGQRVIDIKLKQQREKLEQYRKEYPKETLNEH